VEELADFSQPTAYLTAALLTTLGTFVGCGHEFLSFVWAKDQPID